MNLGHVKACVELKLSYALNVADLNAFAADTFIAESKFKTHLNLHDLLTDKGFSHLGADVDHFPAKTHPIAYNTFGVKLCEKLK